MSTTHLVPVPRGARTATAADKRRSRRRAETVEEILETAVAVMADHGVAGLSLSEVARRIGMAQPSLYKYFPSLLAVYDELFKRGAIAVLDVVRGGGSGAASGSAPGLPALAGAVEGLVRWGFEQPVIAQLLYWRTVPGFTPSPAAYAPTVTMVEEIGGLLQAAVDCGHLNPGAASDEGVAVLSILVAGITTQQFANEPDSTYEDGRFTRLTPKLLEMFVRTYPPKE
jgi:AcrR family transcriptional regulator